MSLLIVSHLGTAGQNVRAPLFEMCTPHTAPLTSMLVASLPPFIAECDAGRSEGWGVGSRDSAGRTPTAKYGCCKEVGGRGAGGEIYGPSFRETALAVNLLRSAGAAGRWKRGTQGIRVVCLLRASCAWLTPLPPPSPVHKTTQEHLTHPYHLQALHCCRSLVGGP